MPGDKGDAIKRATTLHQPREPRRMPKPCRPKLTQIVSGRSEQYRVAPNDFSPIRATRAGFRRFADMRKHPYRHATDAHGAGNREEGRQYNQALIVRYQHDAYADTKDGERHSTKRTCEEEIQDGDHVRANARLVSLLLRRGQGRDPGSP